MMAGNGYNEYPDPGKSKIHNKSTSQNVVQQVHILHNKSTTNRISGTAAVLAVLQVCFIGSLEVRSAVVTELSMFTVLRFAM